MKTGINNVEGNKLTISLANTYQGEYNNDSKIVVFENVINISFNDTILAISLETAEVIYFRVKQLCSWHIENTKTVE